MKKISNILMGLICLVVTNQVIANQHQIKTSENTHVANNDIYWEVDVAFLASIRKTLIPDILEKEKELSPVISLSGGFYYKNFFIEAAPLSGRPFTIGYTVHEDDNQQISVITESLFFKLTEESQESGFMLNGIEERKSSMEVGVEYFAILKKNDVRLKLLHDGLGRHKGTIASIEIYRPLFTKYLMIVPGLSLTYVDDNAANYYYGVSKDEATTFRPQYEAKGTFISTARLYLERPINDDWSVVGAASYSFFGDGISGSPLAQGRKETYSMSVGVLWTF